MMQVFWPSEGVREDVGYTDAPSYMNLRIVPYPLPVMFMQGYGTPCKFEIYRVLYTHFLGRPMHVL